VQQLREGVNNFFATFIGVLCDRDEPSLEVDPGVTSGDYLNAYLLGTRNALYDNGRVSVTIMIERIDPQSIGALIALYERAVGFYATLVNINAYHQPGVEAGKKMAGAVIALQGKILAHLRKNPGASFTAEEVAKAIDAEDSVETVYIILDHASVNQDHRVQKMPTALVFDSRYMIRDLS
jgi:glucose-6-phosphate isomerase